MSADDLRAADWRLRVAFHKAGHQLAAYLLLGRRGVGRVTAEPASAWVEEAHHGSWQGLASHGTLAVRPIDIERAKEAIGKPLALWPIAMRRRFEIEALISRAGAHAEVYRTWPEDLADRWEPRRRRSDLSRATVAAFIASAADSSKAAAEDRNENDLAHAYRAADALVGPERRQDDLARHWNAEARALIGGCRAKRMLTPLAHELLYRGTLERCEVLQSLEAADLLRRRPETL